MAQRLGKSYPFFPFGLPCPLLIYIRLILARRFHRQIFLSVDVPATLLSTPRGSHLLFDAEKGIVAALSSLGEHGQEVS